MTRRKKNNLLNGIKFIHMLVLAIVLVVVGAALYKPQREQQILATTTLPPLPEQTHWVNQGTAFTEGAEGEWDRYLWGGFANSLIKKDGVYYVYYQGSTGYDDTCGDNTYRQIGVATSIDGVTWTKHSANPVISWVDQRIVTEGSLSSAALMGPDGQVYVYYGAGSGYNAGCLIRANGRVSASTDGVTFTDLGQVIPNVSPLWGFGDEIFPVGAYTYNSNWYVYYIPNGVSRSRRLGVVPGTTATAFDLNASGGVNNGGVPAWGPVSVVNDGVTFYAFVNELGKNNVPAMKVYSFSPSVPNMMTLRKTYTFADCFQGSVIFDESENRWLMLCRDRGGSTFYRVKTATALISSPTPTSTPGASASPTVNPTASPKLRPTPTPSSTTTLLNNK